MTPFTLSAHVIARVKALRTNEYRKWSQGDLAAQMNARGMTRWTANTVTKAEGEKLSGRIDYLADLVTLCEVFDMSLTELLAGDGDVILDGTKTTKSLHSIRLALIGLAPPTDPMAAIVDEYSVDRIVHLCRLSHAGELQNCTRALYDREWFLQVRDERAGITIRPGSRANIAARRGHATKVMVKEIRAALDEHGIQWMHDTADAKRKAMATDDIKDEEM